MNNLILVAMLFIGLVAGIFLTVTVMHHKSVGALRIDQSDSKDGPYLFLELSTDISSFQNKQYIALTIKNENLIPHK